MLFMCTWLVHLSLAGVKKEQAGSFKVELMCSNLVVWSTHNLPSCLHVGYNIFN